MKRNKLQAKYQKIDKCRTCGYKNRYGYCCVQNKNTDDIETDIKSECWFYRHYITMDTAPNINDKYVYDEDDGYFILEIEELKDFNLIEYEDENDEILDRYINGRENENE
jgi:hypothetical protein